MHAVAMVLAAKILFVNVMTTTVWVYPMIAAIALTEYVRMSLPGLILLTSMVVATNIRNVHPKASAIVIRENVNVFPVTKAKPVLDHLALMTVLDMEDALTFRI